MKTSAPLGLTVLVIAMALCALAGPLFWDRSAHPEAQLAVLYTPVVCAPVLWFLWRGKRWARWLVIATTVGVVIPYAAFYLLDDLAWYRIRRDPELVVALIEGLLGVVVLAYLFRRNVRAYFKRGVA